MLTKDDPSRSGLVPLIKAILARVREKEGFVTKTKLFKYLYLIDIEYFRRTGQLLTGFGWIFYHYGPWAQQCEDLYANLRNQGEISVKLGSMPDRETEFVDTSEPVELENVIEDIGLELAIRRIIDRWADRRLGEMLDYVYLHTEPMEGAERGKPLDFSKVTPYPAHKLASLPPRSPSKKAMERMHRAIAEKKAVESSPSASQFTPPRYDDVYFEALQVMEEEEDGH